MGIQCRVLIAGLWCLLATCFPNGLRGEPPLAEDRHNDVIGIAPQLAPPSVKNGEVLRVSAVVDSELPILSVSAVLGGIATLELRRDADQSGLEPQPDGRYRSTFGAEWIGERLEEKVYPVVLLATDVMGRSCTNATLTFSDPAAGNSTPGTPEYPNGGMRRIDGLGMVESTYVNCIVFDASRRFAYAGMRDGIAKVAAGSGEDAPVVAGFLPMEPQEEPICGVIDPATGHAYFGTLAGHVVKVALGEGNAPPRRVGSCLLDPESRSLQCAVIDPSAGYAYFATNSSPGRVVKVALGEGDAAPHQVAAISLAAGEGGISCAVIAPESGLALFGTDTTVGNVVKVALGAGPSAPVRLGALALPEEGKLKAAAFDPIGGYAFFGSEQDPARIVKIAMGSGLAPPVRLGALTLAERESTIRCAGWDSSAGYAYFGLPGLAGGIVVKVAPGEGSAAPVRVGAGTLLSTESMVWTAALDAAGGQAYLGIRSTPGAVVKVSLGAGTAPPSRIGAATLSPDGSAGILADSSYGGYGYAVAYSSSFARVIKFALGKGAVPPRRVGSVELPSGSWPVATISLDPVSKHCILGTATTPARVVKVAFGQGDDAPEFVASTSLPVNEGPILSAAIDAANGQAYFGVLTTPARIVKVALGAGSDPPTRLGMGSLEPGDGAPTTGLLDPNAGYAYFGAGGAAGRVVKLAMGDGDAPPARIGALELDDLENPVLAGAIDAARGYAYFGTGTWQVRVVKVALGEGDNLPSRQGTLELDAAINHRRFSSIDPEAGVAFFGFSGDTGRILKVSLGEGNAPPELVGSVFSSEKNGDVRSATFDLASGCVHVLARTSRSRIVRLGLSQRGLLNGTRFVLPEDGSIHEVRFHSHVDSGSVRLALYTDDEPKRLVWESGVTENTAKDSDLVVPLARGIPTSLSLPPGVYWAAWQVDTNAAVPSLTTSSQGAGFSVLHEFGPAPLELPSADLDETNESWTQWVTYSAFTEPSASGWHLY